MFMSFQVYESKLVKFKKFVAFKYWFHSSCLVVMYKNI